jgi:hypothetical protein
MEQNRITGRPAIALVLCAFVAACSGTVNEFTVDRAGQSMGGAAISVVPSQSGYTAAREEIE